MFFYIFIVLLTLHTTLTHPVHHQKVHGGKTRIVYLAAIDIEWDYAPNGNLFNSDPLANNFIQNGPNRIGSIYDKVVYREYTDNSFLRPVPVPSWQGIVGPLFRAEVGDTILIRFANLAFKCNASLTVHAHGIFYQKNAEGALYEDNTTGSDKQDDGIAPGQTYTYEWDVKETFAPTYDDDNCLAWGYHSHRSAPRDTNTGLMGLFLVCKRGVLDYKGHRQDIDREYVIFMDTTDEQNSHCIQQNIQRCGNATECAALLTSGDAAFRASNQMSNINGYVYGNLPGLEANVGEKVVWHFFSLNNGIQSAHINGQTFTYKNHRLDTLNFYAASFSSGVMIPEHDGLWLMQSRIFEWYLNGMMAYVLIKPRRNQISRHPYAHYGPNPSPYYSQRRRRTRTYYIAIEKVVWDYIPSAMNLYQGGAIDAVNTTSARFYTRSANTIGSQYLKALYVEYTDYTFTRKKVRARGEEHLGFLGPVIRAEVGDRLEIVLKNKADRDYTIWVHGLTYPKSEEGFVIKDPFTNITTGKFARPGETVHYSYVVSHGVGPTKDDPVCVTYTYQSAVDAVRDVYTGLVGPMLICKPGQSYNWKSHFSSSSGHWSHLQHQENRRFFLIFMTIDEGSSHYLDENIQRFTLNPGSVQKNDNAFVLSNVKFTINGRGYGNLEGLDMCIGDHVTWHVFGLGSFRDTHGVNFQGQTIQILGNTVEGKVINPGLGITAHSVPDSVGRWSVQCRSTPHFNFGMVALNDVFSCGAYHSRKWGYRSHYIRRYYIAAVEIDWDYAPIKIDLITGLPLNNTSQPGYAFVRNDGGNFIGSVYKKAVYREFTDDTFTTQKTRGPDEEHLGVLGPYIKANVGERVEVVFKNMASRNYSLHPQGMFYNKGNEGANYQDGSHYTGDNSVAPGDTYVYRWEVPRRSGPGKTDPNCIGWLYHSAVDPVKDMFSGLVGPLVICRPGILDKNGKRKDKVAKEFAVLFMIFEEAGSYYYAENSANFAPNRVNISDPDFVFSNTMFSINGFIYGNLKGLDITVGETVAWYVMGLGDSLGVHPVHFHGQTFIHRTDKAHRKDVIEVFPSTTETVEMFTDNPGTWLFHCHVAFHVTNGMEAVYNILDKRHTSHHINRFLFHSY